MNEKRVASNRWSAGWAQTDAGTWAIGLRVWSHGAGWDETYLLPMHTAREMSATLTALAQAGPSVPVVRDPESWQAVADAGRRAK